MEMSAWQMLKRRICFYVNNASQVAGRRVFLTAVILQTADVQAFV